MPKKGSAKKSNGESSLVKEAQEFLSKSGGAPKGRTRTHKQPAKPVSAVKVRKLVVFSCSNLLLICDICTEEGPKEERRRKRCWKEEG